MFNIKNRYLRWREDRFLRKHYCRNRIEYERKYDPDYVPRASQVRNFYQGYQHVLCFENRANYVYERIYDYGPGGYRDGFHIICDWCKENLTGKWRYDMLRATKEPSTSNQWELNEISGGDYWFFAFQDEEDYFMFKLQWGS